MPLVDFQLQLSTLTPFRAAWAQTTSYPPALPTAASILIFQSAPYGPRWDGAEPHVVKSHTPSYLSSTIPLASSYVKGGPVSAST